jgi:hypothetical protein
MSEKFPVMVFTGPRQSGKTTLCKELFPNHQYVTMEDPDNRRFVEADPRGFLRSGEANMIIDEAQNAPELFSFIQGYVDHNRKNGQYILSGSQNFQLLERITQSLAGRAYIAELLPLRYKEIKQVEDIGLWDMIHRGGYPAIYDRNIEPSDFYPSYVRTYVERDLRTVVSVHDLGTFRKFMRLLAAQTGQLFNAHLLSKKLGVDSKTVSRWLSVLQTTYIAFQLEPWYENFSKRIVRSSKVYFYDTGLVCSLLGIKSAQELEVSPFRGALFENYALLEIMKHRFAHGIDTGYYFWRDSNGREIDLVLEEGIKVQFVEMKASMTVKGEFIDGLHYLDKLANDYQLKHHLFCAVDESQQRSYEQVVSWKDGGLIN